MLWHSVCVKARSEIQCVDACMYVCTYVTENAARDLGHTVCRDLGDFFPLPETWSFTVGGRCLLLLMTSVRTVVQLKLVRGFEIAIVRRKTHFIVLGGGRDNGVGEMIMVL